MSKLSVSLIKRVESAFSIFGLLIGTSALVPLLYEAYLGRAQPGQGYPLLQVIWFGIYTLAFCFLALTPKRSTFAASRDTLLLLLLLFACLSIIWSENKSLTLRRDVGLIGTTLFGIYLGSRYSLKEQLRLLGWSLGIATIGSLLLCLLIPSLGVESTVHAGAWRGIYHQKNVLGRYMGFSSIVFLLLAIDACRYRNFLWLMFCLSLTLLLLSTSKGALVTSVSVLALLPFYRALRLKHNIKVSFFISLILVGGSIGTIALSNIETILSSLGRDVTLSGRTELWNICSQYFHEKPWLGYGYGNAFWSIHFRDVWDIVGWKPRHSHNGFLEIILDIGIVGFAFFSCVALRLVFNSNRWIKANKTVIGLWPLALLTFAFLSNLTESVILFPNNIFLILCVSTAISMPIELNRVRRERNSRTISSQQELMIYA